MLEHLLNADPKQFLPPERVTANELLTAQINSIDASCSDEEALDEAQRAAARNAFLSITTGQTQEQQKEALSRLEVPEAVKQLVGMLSAYDWAFVEQAKEMRGYTVAKILEETQHPDARHRLKALELLGKVTEVALFTERHEVKKAGLTDEELDEELKKRLDKYMSIKEHVIEAQRDEIEAPRDEIEEAVPPSLEDKTE